jgi:hypothetical protein
MMGPARYAHAIQINCTHEEIRSIQDSFLRSTRATTCAGGAQLYRGALGRTTTEALARPLHGDLVGILPWRVREHARALALREVAAVGRAGLTPGGGALPRRGAMMRKPDLLQPNPLLRRDADPVLAAAKAFAAARASSAVLFCDRCAAITLRRNAERRQQPAGRGIVQVAEGAGDAP